MKPPKKRVIFFLCVLAGVVMAIVPFSSVFLLGYALWYRYKMRQQKVCRLCAGKGWVDCGNVGAEECWECERKP